MASREILISQLDQKRSQQNKNIGEHLCGVFPFLQRKGEDGERV